MTWHPFHKGVCPAGGCVDRPMWTWQQWVSRNDECRTAFVGPARHLSVDRPTAGHPPSNYHARELQDQIFFTVLCLSPRGRSVPIGIRPPLSMGSTSSLTPSFLLQLSFPLPPCHSFACQRGPCCKEKEPL